MPQKSKFREMEIPRRASKPIWDGVTTYGKASEVLPWLQAAFKQMMMENSSWGKSGIPVGYVGPKFQMPNIQGFFQVVGPLSEGSPRPYITWFSPWSNTQWNMYLEVVKVQYKGTKPIKNR